MANKITIAGAGLSGLSAAYCLSKAGYDATVYEKNQAIRRNTPPYTCVIKNKNGNKILKELQHFGISVKAYAINPRVIKISPNHCKSIGFRNYYLIALGTSDNSFNNQLYVDCLSEGVKFNFNSPSTDANIIATGASSNQPNIYGFGHIYDKMNLDTEATYLVYNNDIAPGGYTYISTKEETSTVMAVSFSKLPQPQLKKLFEKSLSNFKPLKEMVDGAHKIDEIHGSAYYANDPYIYLEQNNQLYVGEAAGIQDSSRGFGIRYAIISGAIAAQSIIENENYTDLMHRYFNDEFIKNLLKREIHNKLTNKDYDNLLAMV